MTPEERTAYHREWETLLSLTSDKIARDARERAERDT
jgi:hypothetical protein